MLRDALPSDAVDVLRLNHESVQYLSALTAERRVALEEMAAAAAGSPRDPVFSEAEWQAIRTMCDGVVPSQSSEVYMTPSLRVQPMPSN